MSESEGSLGERLLTTLTTGSSAVLTGIPLALPGLALVGIAAPTQVGYYLIAFLAAATHATLRRLSAGNSSDLDLSEHSKSEVRKILSTFVVLATLSVTTRLLVGVVGAMALQTLHGQTAVPVLAAVVIPYVDLRLADIDPHLSPSGLVGLGVLWFVKRTNEGWFEWDSTVGDVFEPRRGRFGPI
jgi:hypothetical protein